MLRVARNDAERNNIAFKSLDVVHQYASKFFKTAESGVDKVGSSCEKNPSVHWRYMNFSRQRKTALDAPLYAVSAGRSMIEMLGVLAIVGVLSVGGIAGYSKAMEKWKIDKMIDEYTFLLHGMLEHVDTLKYLNPTSSTVGVVDVLQASGLIPPTWEKMDTFRIWDSNGNLIALFSRNNELGFSVNIGGYRQNDDGKNVSEGFSKQTCLTLFKDLFYPLHSAAYKVWLHHNPTTEIFAGDKFCTPDVQCLRDATLAKMKAACDVCDGKTNCDISIGF